MLFYVLLVLCLLLVYINLIITGEYWKKRNLVHESVLWKFLTGNQSLPEIYKNIYDMYSTKPNVGTYLGTTPILLIRDLENLQAVLTTDFQSFTSRGVTTNPRDILSDNILLIQNFPRWRLMRHKLSPVFTGARLKKMFYIIERCARDFANMIDDRQDMRKITLKTLYTYSTASIGAAVFGIDTHTKNTMDSPFQEMGWVAFEPTLAANLTFITSFVSEKILNLLNLKFFGQFETFFVGAMKDVLKQRRCVSEKKHDFIDLCLELQKSGTLKDPLTGYEIEPTDEILASNAFILFIAGSETSASTMSFALFELSKNQQILATVHEEIDRVFDECDDEVTHNEIEKLTYLDQVINETMRKYPPIGFTIRKCTKDTVLPVGNVKVEKGILVVVPIFALHRDETYFPDPETFDPNRFAPEHVSNIKKFSYLPFGEGNRICIGMRYAKLQVKTGLAWLLRKNTLKIQKEIPCHFERHFFSIRNSDNQYDLIAR